MTVSFTLKKQLSQFALDVSCRFPSGVLVIQGASGSGKTTILNCLSGLLQPDSGQIQIDNHVLYDSARQIHVAAQRRNIGYVFQNYALFPNMTVEKNILYGVKNQPGYGDKTQRKAMLDYAGYIMDRFRLTPLRKQYPVNISGGEKQRTAVARSLMNNPYIILADEPTGNLDSKSCTAVIEAFLRAKEEVGATIFMVTHDSYAASFCDRVIVLKDGTIYQEIKKTGSRRQFMDQLLDILRNLGGDGHDNQ